MYTTLYTTLLPYARTEHGRCCFSFNIALQYHTYTCAWFVGSSLQYLFFLSFFYFLVRRIPSPFPPLFFGLSDSLSSTGTSFFFWLPGSSPQYLFFGGQTCRTSLLVCTRIGQSVALLRPRKCSPLLNGHQEVLTRRSERFFMRMQHTATQNTRTHDITKFQKYSSALSSIHFT